MDELMILRTFAAVTTVRHYSVLPKRTITTCGPSLTWDVVSAGSQGRTSKDWGAWLPDECEQHPDRPTDAFQDDLQAITPRVCGRTGLNDFHAGSQIQCHQFGFINEGRTEAEA
jgi:hypothetical protein